MFQQQAASAGSEKHYSATVLDNISQMKAQNEPFHLNFAFTL